MRTNNQLFKAFLCPKTLMYLCIIAFVFSKYETVAQSGNVYFPEALVYHNAWPDKGFYHCKDEPIKKIVLHPADTSNTKKTRDIAIGNYSPKYYEFHIRVPELLSKDGQFVIINDDSSMFAGDCKNFGAAIIDGVLPIVEKNWTYLHQKKASTKNVDRDAMEKRLLSLLIAKTKMIYEIESKEKKRIFTSYWSQTTSARTDLETQKKILAFYAVGKFKAVKVYFMERAWAIVKDDNGQINSKQIFAAVVFKDPSNNKCYIKYATFGYRYEGGGVYSTELEAWKYRSSMLEDITLFRDDPKDERKMYPDQLYELDCSVLK